jgi:hypothetical protein
VSDHDDGEAVGQEPTALQRALELLVFAPVGVAVTLAEDLPGLIGKGRERFESDISNARVVGQFVVRHGQRQLVARAGKLLHRERSDDVPDPSHTPPSTAGAPTTPTAATTASASTKPVADPADGAIVEGALAGYDTLSASQVVRRLESLGPDELRALHRHEASHRNRRTILNRAHQILEAVEARGPISSPPETEAAPEPDRSGE